MLLTDPAVQYWTCVVAILTTVAVLMLWNKVRGPLVVRGLSRAGLLIGGYTATAVAVLVSVNIAYGGLIVSVSDLFANVNPPMGQFANYGGCAGHDHGGREMQARALAAASAAAQSSAGARNPGQAFDDAEAPPPGVDPALGGGAGGGGARPCQTASAAPSAAPSAGPSAATATATSAATPASAAVPAEAHALK
jgi:hypothetical protein